MNVEFRMPDIGEGIAEVELLEWHVEVGTRVREFDTLATIQTDKSIVEMPSPVTGTVAALGPEVGDILPVGEVLIVFDTVETAPGTAVPAGLAEPIPPALGEAAPSETSAGLDGIAASRPRAAPVVRRLAAELGVDLAAVGGSGSGGRIMREDVQRAAALPALAGEARATPATDQSAIGRRRDQGGVVDAEDERVPVRGLRRQIARKMAESWRSVPHITDWRECDARQLISVRRDVLTHLPELAGSLTYLPFIVKIVATALRRHPLLNASFDEEASEYLLHRRINIGVATATDDGLLVPVVHNADRKSIAELAAEIAELVAVTRKRKATLEQLSGGTYTVNNIGAIGGHLGTPIIRTPEVGILAFGRIADRVVAIDGMPVVRPTIGISSVGDHRLHDGDTLGAFTSTVVQLIEHPYSLLAELR